MQAKHTASGCHAALLVLEIRLCILALVCIIGGWRLALALVGSRGLLVVVLGHGGYDMSLGPAGGELWLLCGDGAASRPRIGGTAVDEVS